MTRQGMSEFDLNEPKVAKDLPLQNCNLLRHIHCFCKPSNHGKWAKLVYHFLLTGKFASATRVTSLGVEDRLCTCAFTTKYLCSYGNTKPILQEVLLSVVSC